MAPNGQKCPLLKPTVVIGYNDMSASSSRALLGIDEAIILLDVEVEESVNQSAKIALNIEVLPEMKDAKPIQLINLKEDELSLVIVSADLSADECPSVCDKLVKLFVENGVEWVIISSSLLLSGDMSDIHNMYENAFFVPKKTTNPSLDLETRFKDPFLSCLLQFLKIACFPTTLLTGPGFKAKRGLPNGGDYSMQNIKGLQRVLTAMLAVRFDLGKSFSLEFKGQPEETNSDHLYA